MYVFARAPARVPGQPTSAGTSADMVLSHKSHNPAATQRADSRLKSTKHVVSTVHGTRTVLLDSRSGRYFGLDEVGSRIWQLAEAGLPPSEIAEKLAEEYDAPADRLEQDVHEFIMELKDSRLLEDR